MRPGLAPATDLAFRFVPSGPPDRILRHFAMAAVIGLAPMALSGCTPPPPPPISRINLQSLPQLTRDAMLHVRIAPLGAPPPNEAGSLGPMLGYGCGDTPVTASLDAVQQLQAKALVLRATAVIDVLIQPADPVPCHAPYGAIAGGIAVSPYFPQSF